MPNSRCTDEPMYRPPPLDNAGAVCGARRHCSHAGQGSGRRARRRALLRGRHHRRRPAALRRDLVGARLQCCWPAMPCHACRPPPPHTPSPHHPLVPLPLPSHETTSPLPPPLAGTWRLARASSSPSPGAHRSTRSTTKGRSCLPATSWSLPSSPGLRRCRASQSWRRW